MKANPSRVAKAKVFLIRTLPIRHVARPLLSRLLALMHCMCSVSVRPLKSHYLGAPCAALAKVSDSLRCAGVIRVCAFIAGPSPIFSFSSFASRANIWLYLRMIYLSGSSTLFISTSTPRVYPSATVKSLVVVRRRIWKRGEGLLTCYQTSPLRLLVLIKIVGSVLDESLQEARRSVVFIRTLFQALHLLCCKARWAAFVSCDDLD